MCLFPCWSLILICTPQNLWPFTSGFYLGLPNTTFLSDACMLLEVCWIWENTCAVLGLALLGSFGGEHSDGDAFVALGDGGGGGGGDQSRSHDEAGGVHDIAD